MKKKFLKSVRSIDKKPIVILLYPDREIRKFLLIYNDPYLGSIYLCNIFHSRITYIISSIETSLVSTTRMSFMFKTISTELIHFNTGCHRNGTVNALRSNWFLGRWLISIKSTYIRSINYNSEYRSYNHTYMSIVYLPFTEYVYRNYMFFTRSSIMRCYVRIYLVS